MITRDEARRIAEGGGGGPETRTLISGVYSLDEITCRKPSLYNGPDLSTCWIAYVERPPNGLRSSLVILISRASGDVLYYGTANDEG